MQVQKRNICILLTLSLQLSGILALPPAFSLSKRSEIGGFDPFADLDPHGGIDSSDGYDDNSGESANGDPVDGSPSEGVQDGNPSDGGNTNPSNGNTEFVEDGVKVTNDKATGQIKCDFDGLCPLRRRSLLLRRDGCFPEGSALQSPEIIIFNKFHTSMLKVELTLKKAQLGVVHDEILSRFQKLIPEQIEYYKGHEDSPAHISGSSPDIHPASFTEDTMVFNFYGPDSDAPRIIDLSPRDLADLYSGELDACNDLDGQRKYQKGVANSLGFNPDDLFSPSKGKMVPPEPPDSGVPLTSPEGRGRLDFSDLPSAQGPTYNSPLGTAQIRDFFPDTPEIKGQVEVNTDTDNFKTYQEAKDAFNRKAADYTNQRRIAERSLENRYGLKPGTLEGILTKAGVEGVDVPIPGQKAPIKFKMIGNKLIVQGVAWTKGEKIAVGTIISGTLLGIVGQDLKDQGVF